VLQAASAYLNAYYTVSIGQWIAHDLRQSIYAHLQRLSMSYYDSSRSGPLISTITDDVNAVQDFVVDVAARHPDRQPHHRRDAGGDVLAELSFTLIALAVVPLVCVFASAALGRQAGDPRRAAAAERARHHRAGGARRIRVVKAFAQGAFERERLAPRAWKACRRRSTRGGSARCSAGGHRPGGARHRGVLWFGARLVLADAMTAGALVVFITYLGKLFRPIQDLARASTNIAQAAVGLERVRAVLDADERLPRSPHARKLGGVEGRVEFRRVTFGYDPSRSC
jgi:subfamily B ATP-binding cassette protein MsbA